MKALVTGAAGFVGSYLVPALQERGWSVTTLDVRKKIGANRSIVADLTDLTPAHFRGERFDAVFHLAAISNVPVCDHSPGLAWRVNVLGSLRLLRSLPRGPRIVFVSSGDVYGRVQGYPIREDSTVHPTNAYSASKACADALMQARLDDQEIVLVRPFNHTGPRQSDLFVASDWCRQVAMAEAGRRPATIGVGNLDPVREFLDVRDVVRAYLLAFEKAAPGVYNICSGRGTRIRDLLRMILGMARIKLQVTEDTSRKRSGEANVRIGDPSRFRKATGWKPSIPLRKTLADLLQHERARAKHKL